MHKIIETDQSRPGVCTEAGLAQAQFNLSGILANRAEDSGTSEGESRLSDAVISERLERSAMLAHRARKVLLKPHPLGPLKGSAYDQQRQQFDSTPSLDANFNGVPKEHELALFDHLQPVFDGRFTGLHLLQYLQDQDSRR
jgi:hypothetical protein